MHDCKILPTSSEYHDGSIKPLHPLHNISMSLGCPPNGVSREFPRLCPWPLPATFAGEANSCITTILGPMGTMTQLQDCDLVEPSDIGFDPGISMYCLQHKAQTLETTYVLNIYMMSSGCFMSKKTMAGIVSMLVQIIMQYHLEVCEVWQLSAQPPGGTGGYWVEPDRLWVSNFGKVIWQWFGDDH